MTTEMLVQETEDERVIKWRTLRLAAAGYGEEESGVLALRTDIDLHKAIDMVERLGCDPAVAFKILV